jgi:hypothetical protein
MIAAPPVPTITATTFASDAPTVRICRIADADDNTVTESLALRLVLMPLLPLAVPSALSRFLLARPVNV